MEERVNIFILCVSITFRENEKMRVTLFFRFYHYVFYLKMPYRSTGICMILHRSRLKAFEGNELNVNQNDRHGFLKSIKHCKKKKSTSLFLSQKHGIIFYRVNKD